MIELRGITKEYVHSSHHLSGIRSIDICLHPGEFVVVTGRSGSGKSTLLSVAGLLDRPDSGEVWIDGQPTAQLTEFERAKIRRERLGFLFQFSSLVPAMSVLENVFLPKALAGLVEPQDKERAKSLLKQVGLEECANLPAHVLSDGESRRAALCRAIFFNPPYLLADEPTGALDPDTAEQIQNLMIQLHGNGTAILLVTHDSRFQSAADRVLNVNEGRLVMVKSILRENGLQKFDKELSPSL